MNHKPSESATITIPYSEYYQILETIESYNKGHTLASDTLTDCLKTIAGEIRKMRGLNSDRIADFLESPAFKMSVLEELNRHK